MQNRAMNNILLLITAFIWGAGFVAQRAGMDFIEPYTFNCVRSYLGAFSLLIPILIFKIKKGPNRKMNKWEERRYMFKAGAICGLALFFASSVQQVGMVYTSASKAGFISSMYIIIVPLISVFLGRKFPWSLWFGVLLGAFGLYFLCGSNGFSQIGRGDIYIMISAVLYSVHILTIDYFAPKVDSVKLSCVQFFVVGFISLIPVYMFESPTWDGILACKWALLFAGVVSCGLAYTLQIIAQKNTNPALASLLLSFESVFAVLTGYLILNETLTAKEILGCILMFAAVLVAQYRGKNLSDDNAEIVSSKCC